MTAYYDISGFLCDAEAAIGQADVAPAIVEGCRPNWNGYAWVQVPNNPPLEPVPLPPPGPPTVITMRQARLALLEDGKLAEVAPALDSLPSPQREAAQIEWEYATEVRRDWPLVQQLAPALGLDDAALDALFAKAASL